MALTVSLSGNILISLSDVTITISMDQILTKNLTEQDGDKLQAGWSSEFQWGEYSPHLSRPALGPIHPPLQCVPGLFSRGRGTEVW